MKLIHCADLHLDSHFSNLTREEARKRRAELLETFLRTADFAEQEKAAAVLIAGDLFDTSVVSRQVRTVFLDAVRRHPRICFFYLRGNHDRSGFSDGEIPANLKLFGETWKTYVLRDTLNQDIPSASRPVAVTGAELTAANAAVLPETLSLDPRAFNVVLLHGQVRDSASGADALGIDLRKYENRNIDYLALGHVHAFQEGPLNPRGIWCYPGCLAARGYDECGAHGFLLLSVDEGNDAEKNRSFSLDFISSHSREYHEVFVDVSGCGTTAEMAERIQREFKESDAEKTSDAANPFPGGCVSSDSAETGAVAEDSDPSAAVRDEPAYAAEASVTRDEPGHASAAPAPRQRAGSLAGIPASDFVKIVLCGRVRADAEKNTALLEQLFGGRFCGLRIEDRTKLAVNYEDYALEASLKGEFVRLIEADPALTDDEKAETIRCGILALLGEEAEF